MYDLYFVFWKIQLNIRRIVNHIKEHYDKLEYFINALEKNGEGSIIDIETIELFSVKKYLIFLILLFLKLYLEKNTFIQFFGFSKIYINSKKNESGYKIGLD